jgi:hypothetical protein
MKKLVLLTLIVVSLTSCAQMNKSIVKAAAFYTIPIPGTIPVDDAGQPLAIHREKVYNVFLEVKDNSTVWAKAWTDGKLFSVIPQAIKGTTVVVGKRRRDGTQIVMKAGAQSSLVQLELAPGEVYTKPPQTLANGEILLEGKWKGKNFYYKIPTVIELASPEYQ